MNIDTKTSISPFFESQFTVFHVFLYDNAPDYIF
jgi:hypothetical protein